MINIFIKVEFRKDIRDKDRADKDRTDKDRILKSTNGKNRRA